MLLWGHIQIMSLNLFTGCFFSQPVWLTVVIWPSGMLSLPLKLDSMNHSVYSPSSLGPGLSLLSEPRSSSPTTAKPPVLFPGLLLKKKYFCSKYYYQTPLIGPATLVVVEKNLPLT